MAETKGIVKIVKKKVIKSIVFLLSLTLLTVCFHTVFCFKYGDGIYPLKNFYREPKNSIDVMCFGSSHVFENINTGTLWDEYGIASFDLCGSVQPLWNTYYYMKEALKYQTPRVMVLDVYRVLEENDFTDSSRIIKNTYGLKLSKDKINAIKISAPKEEWLNYLLEYPTYHSRYTDITSADFLPYLGAANRKYWKGFGINTGRTELERPDGLNHITERMELSDKTREYLEKIIALSKSSDIPLLLIVAPYQANESDQKKYNEVARIAEANNIPFINYNLLYDEIGLDFSSDFADNNHLNHIGNIKFTKYLAQYLKSNYEIPDRRGNASYQSYDIMSEDCRQRIYNVGVRAVGDIGTYLQKLQNKHYLVIYALTGNYKAQENYADVKNQLLKYGINPDSAECNAVWIVQDQELLYTSCNEKVYIWHKDVGINDTLAVRSESEESAPVINLNRTEYMIKNSGINICVYDTFLGTLVETACFPVGSGGISYQKTKNL